MTFRSRELVVGAAVVASVGAAGAVVVETANPTVKPAPVKTQLAGVTNASSARSATTPTVIWGASKAPARHRIRPNLKGTPAAGILIDATTGQVMWSKHAYERRPIASLTKMMNALVAVNLAKPDKRIRISNYAASVGGSTVGGLPAGGTMRVGSLLRGMLIVSGNDAANALADALGPDRRRFVARMNAHAHTMRLRCTHFTSPEGLGEGNRSCAHDLALIAKAILANPTLRSTVSKKWDTIERGRNGHKLLRNRNPLMQRNYPGITGIKTGHTISAGWCLVASAKRGNRRLISVVLAQDERAWQTQRLLDAGFRALKR